MKSSKVENFQAKQPSVFRPVAVSLSRCIYPIVGQAGIAVFQEYRSPVYKTGTLQRALHRKIILVCIDAQVAVILSGKGYAAGYNAASGAITGYTVDHTVRGVISPPTVKNLLISRVRAGAEHKTAEDARIF